MSSSPFTLLGRSIRPFVFDFLERCGRMLRPYNKKAALVWAAICVLIQLCVDV
jgi:hypothetical protein